MLRIIRVSGLSMTPTLNDGDYIIITKPRSIKPGFIYVLRHDRLGRMVKRLSRLESGFCYWAGDSVESTASDKIGSTPKSLIIGQARWVIKPTGMKRL